MHVDGNVEFYKRMLIIFLGLLEVPGETRPADERETGGRRLCGRSSWQRGSECPTPRSVAGTTIG